MKINFKIPTICHKLKSHSAPSKNSKYHNPLKTLPLILSYTPKARLTQNEPTLQWRSLSPNSKL